MKRILLHTCCAPCSVSCIPYLKEEDVEITAFWYNPNIHPFKEYEARRNCLAEYMEREKIPLILREDYGLREFVKNVAGDIEGRCTYCYSVRLAETAKTAKEMGFDGFTSTLFASLYQNPELWLKKRRSWQRNTRLSFTTVISDRISVRATEWHVKWVFICKNTAVAFFPKRTVIKARLIA